MNPYLHIVCLDAPAPPNYGGAIDMYYKVKAMADAGRKIILHYFAYKPDRNAGSLEAICERVYAYPRKDMIQSLPLRLPHIVSSRISEELIGRLNNDQHPVLLEGLHCSGIINRLRHPHRVVLRMHNEEAGYYKMLAKAERNPLKRIYYQRESSLLHAYQKGLPRSLKLACLADTDSDFFRKRYGFTNVHFIPCFIPWSQIQSREGKGNYCLYHGNLSVSENEKAALWLLEEVFSRLKHPLVIAGSGASSRLKAAAEKLTSCRLVTDPAMEDLHAIIRDAHIHVLPSMNSTGVKLKLLHVLFNGRFCITNSKGVEGSRINGGLQIADTPEAFIAKVEEWWEEAFTADHASARREMADLYNNANNARLLSELC